MSNYNSTYLYYRTTELLLGLVYFINYSVITLVYIILLLLTLTPLLISVTIILFSYLLAHSMALKSNINITSELLLPFQLQLLIRIVNNRLTALGSYLIYILGQKNQKITVIPVLWHIVIIIVALVILT